MVIMASMAARSRRTSRQADRQAGLVLEQEVRAYFLIYKHETDRPRYR